MALLARSKDKLEALVQELGANSRCYECDVASWDSVSSATQKAIQDFGSLDAVFANAGRGIGPGGFTGGDPSDWKDLVNVNILGVMYTIRASADALKKSKGRLVLTSSIAGRRILKGSVYGSTKWAVSGIGYNAREEFAEHGVGVTLIEPGMVDTAFFDDAKPDALRARDVAETVWFALSRPSNVAIHELQILPMA